MTSIAQRVMLRYERPDLDGELRELLGSFPVGGVHLCGQALGPAARVRALTTGIQALAPAGLPIFVAIRQEGGEHQAWGPPHQEPLPSAAQVGWDAEAAGERFEVTLQAMNLGRQLADAGINLNFAPVLDVGSGHGSPDERCFGSRPEPVAEVGAAFVEGLQAAGVLACGKHFPGLGDAGVDPRSKFSIVSHDRGRLENVALRPFRAAIAAGLQTVKMAGALYPAWDPERPATFAPAIAGDLLRADLGFEGVVFSDELEAGRDSRDLVEASLLAFEAGCDVVLAPVGPAAGRELLEGLESARRQGRLEETRLRESIHRVVTVKQDWLSEA